MMHLDRYNKTLAALNIFDWPRWAQIAIFCTLPVSVPVWLLALWFVGAVIGPICAALDWMAGRD